MLTWVENPVESSLPPRNKEPQCTFHVVTNRSQFANDGLHKPFQCVTRRNFIGIFWVLFCDICDFNRIALDCSCGCRQSGLPMSIDLSKANRQSVFRKGPLQKRSGF